jgi:hypothetical protein
MGLIAKLLTAPVTGPVKAGWWVLERIIEEAEAELYDEQRIVAELRAIAEQVERGEISEDEHAAAEEILLDRLAESRYRRAGGEVE